MSWKHIARLTAIALAFLVGILLIGVAGYRFYLQELYPPPPPANPDTADAPVEPHAERVVIVLLDAVREDLFTDPDLMPNMARLSEQGRTGISITQPVTMTLLSVLNLGTGRTPGLSWSVQNFEAETFPDESIFYWAHAAGRGVAFAGDASWEQLFGPWATDHVTFEDGGIYDAFEGDLSKKDWRTLAAANKYLSHPEEYQVVVVHLTSTDKISHKLGALPREEDGTPTRYGKTGHYVDREVAKLFQDHYQAGDLWLITSDHGATDTGNHGGGESLTRRAPFLLLGDAVQRGPAVEVPLNTWAATLSAASGLPIPRTAEAPVAFDVLKLTPEEAKEVLASHAKRREEFVSGIATDLGAEPAEVSALAAEPPAQMLGDANGFIMKLREHRRWLYYAGLLVGALLHIFGLSLVLRHRGDDDEEPGSPRAMLLAASGIWLLVMTLPFVFDHWLFRIVDMFGRATEGTWYFGRAVLVAFTTTMLVALISRWLLRRGGLPKQVLLPAVWLGFAGAVVATSQIVVKWPFGPLPQTYFALLVWGGLILAWFAFRNSVHRREIVLGAASLGLMVAVFVAGGDHNLQLADETPRTLYAGLAALVVGAGILSYQTARKNEGRSAVAFSLISVVLTTAAALYRYFPEPFWAKVALLAIGAGFIAISLLPLTSEGRRNGVFVLALTTAHVMSSDWIVLMSLGVVGLVLALSRVRIPRTSWTPALIAAAVGLINIGFFYVCGYRYSFTSMDVRTVFMLDQSRINLTAGFLLLALQHSVVWLILWAGVIHNRIRGRDPRGLNTTFLAIVLIFLIRSWGPFFSMEFKLLNHWFISHAVPMFVMTLVECGIATFWFVVISVVFRDRWGQQLTVAGEKSQPAAAALRAESAAAR